MKYFLHLYLATKLERADELIYGYFAFSYYEV